MNNREELILEMRNIDLNALQIFKTVVEQGGVTKAAAKLHRVQSNVTTRVKQLERRLGTKLFLRHNRRLTLSPEGRVLLAYAEQLLRLSAEAEAVLQGATPRGTLRLGALESTAAARLPPILSRYHLAYPEVRIELATGTTGALIARVLNYELEAAFVAEPFSADNLEAQPAFREELILIAPRSFPKIRTPKDIGNRTLIAFETGCAYRRRLEEWLGRDKVVPDRVLEFGSYHAIAACVAAGAGIAVVPRSVMRTTLAEKDVAVYPLPPDIANARTLLIWRRGHESMALGAMRRELGRRGNMRGAA